MVLQGTLLVRLLQLFFRGCRRDAEDVIELCLFGHLAILSGIRFGKGRPKKVSSEPEKVDTSVRLLEIRGVSRVGRL